MTQYRERIIRWINPLTVAPVYVTGTLNEQRRAFKRINFITFETVSFPMDVEELLQRGN